MGSAKAGDGGGRHTHARPLSKQKDEGGPLTGRTSQQASALRDPTASRLRLTTPNPYDIDALHLPMNYLPMNSPSPRSVTTLSQTSFSITSSGVASRAPAKPQIQYQNVSEMKIATGLS